jgi:hypothetical protein
MAAATMKAATIKACHSVTSCMPMHYVLKWQPFRIDALGLVTMIGSEQVNIVVGRLVTSRYTEYLPLLGAFALASNQFTEAISGFELYNLRDRIKTTDLAGWFQRWCIAQNFKRASSTVNWTIQDERETLWRSRLDTLLASLIGIVANGALVALAALQGDWWGLANAISMILSVLVRAYLTNQNRAALDALAAEHAEADKKLDDRARFLVLLNDGKLVTMYATPNLIKACFIDKPVPPNKHLYKITRNIGWIAFTAHVISIGMSGLVTQLLTVFLIVVPTVLTVFKFGCDESLIGSRLKAKIGTAGKGSEKRMDTYINLCLSEAEEKSMLEWSLMPHKDNESWWQVYNEKKLSPRLPNEPAAPQKVETTTTTTTWCLVNKDCTLL